MLCALLPVFAGCGGGGGGSSQPTITGPGTNPGTNPGTDPEPGCVQVADGDCVATSEYLAQRNARAEDKVDAGEYSVQEAFRLINLPQAHAALEVTHGADVKLGAGATVAVIDGGFDGSHYLFSGVDATLITAFKGAKQNEADTKTHGSAVSSVLAGRRIRPCEVSIGSTASCGTNPLLTYIGVAPGVDLDVYAYPLGPFTDGDPPMDPVTFSEAASTVLRRSAPHIVNMSFGVPDVFVENYTEEELRGLYGEDIAALDQTGKQDPTVFVWSAGNNHGDNCDPNEEDVQNCIDNPNIENEADNPDTPDYDGAGWTFNATSPSPDVALMVHIEELRGYSVVVVGVNSLLDESLASLFPPGEIADGSNRCGVAAEWCIAAPWDISTRAHFQDIGPSTIGGRGTSYSAPIVSGGLALMRQFFRGQVNNRDLLTRMFATADKTGRYADEKTYGQGMLDLGAALSPVGTPLIQDLPGAPGRHAPDATRLTLGPAFGDGLPRAVAGREVVALDALGAPFWYPLAGMISRARPPTARWPVRLQGFLSAADPAAQTSWQTPTQPTWSMPIGATRGGWSAHLHNAPIKHSSVLGLAAHHPAVTARRGRWGWTLLRGSGGRHGGLLTWRGEGGLKVRLGALSEAASALGARAGGAFGRIAARSAALGAAWQTPIAGDWRLRMDAELGYAAQTKAQGGLLTELSGLATTAAAVTISRAFGRADHVQFSLSQPLRLERGEARLRLPAGRAPDGKPLATDLAAALRPSGRHLDIAAQWRSSGVWGGELRFAAVYSTDLDHIRGATDAGLLVGWRGVF